MNETKSLIISKKLEFFNQHKQTHIVPFTELDIWNRKLVYKTLFKNNAESYSKQCAVQIFETFYIASQWKEKHLRMGYLRVLWLNWEVCWILLWRWYYLVSNETLASHFRNRWLSTKKNPIIFISYFCSPQQKLESWFYINLPYH